MDAETLVEPDDALPEVELDDLSQPLREACARAGWTKLMPVQCKAIPYLLARRDLMIQSRTGSGKTGAFLLPLLERLDRSRAECQALILVPTRELAQQVSRDAETLFGTGTLRTVAVYGGTPYGPQREAFRKGAHLVVGTPGRVLDHLLRKTLTLDGVDVLVLDEADRMLSMGFYPDMRKVRSYLPKRRVNGYLFSATFPPHVMRLAGEFLHQPEMLSLSHAHVHVPDVLHVYYRVPAVRKDRALVRILEFENPVGAIIFCNTKKMVHYVSVVLKRFGLDADELSADLPQRSRDKVLDRVRDGTLRLLIATDVAARGIDIPELSHVIQYEPPEDPEAYIHRAGRTGRAGAGGRAITLVAAETLEAMELKRIAQRFKIEIVERALPDDGDVAALVGQRVTALLEAYLRTRDQVEVERLKRFVPLAQSLGQTEDQSLLVALLLDDYYMQSLHAPPLPPPEAEAKPPQPDDRDAGSEKKPDKRGGRGRRRRR